MKSFPIQRPKVFKNHPDRSFQDTANFSPSKTYHIRMNDYRKSRILSFKKLQQKQINSASTKNSCEIIFLNSQQQKNILPPKDFQSSTQKIQSLSPLKKIAVNILEIRKNGLIKIDSNSPQNGKKSFEKDFLSPDLRQTFDRKREFQKRKQSIFQKTFCSFSSQPNKNKSLQIRNVETRAPSTHIQSYRPSTRIRKVSNIGDESNSNFLSKYEIIRQLGKGTYGTVFLAKIIKNNKIKSMNKTCIFDSLQLASHSSQTHEINKKSLSKQEEHFNDLNGDSQTFFKNIQNFQLQNIDINAQTLPQNISLPQNKNNNIFQQRKNQYIDLYSKIDEKKDSYLTQVKSLKLQKQKQDKQENFSQSFSKQQTKILINLAENSVPTIQEEDELVAIKVYEKFKMNKDPTKFKNIRKQITIMQNLSHKGVIKLYESVESITKISLVVEFGGDLSLLDYLRKNFPLSNEKLKEFIRQLLQTIIYLHQKNIVHRDIKPQNILIKIDNKNQNNEKLKLIDYGFSTLTNKSRKLNVICGTPNFMAPQLLSSKQYYGEKADVWSFGVVAFVMAQGRHPFKSNDYQELSRIVNKGKYFFRKNHNSLFQQFISQILKVNGQQRPTASQILKHKWLSEP